MTKDTQFQVEIALLVFVYRLFFDEIEVRQFLYSGAFLCIVVCI